LYIKFECAYPNSYSKLIIYHFYYIVYHAWPYSALIFPVGIETHALLFYSVTILKFYKFRYLVGENATYVNGSGLSQ
jgi:hypothetical protein